MTFSNVTKQNGVRSVGTLYRECMVRVSLAWPDCLFFRGGAYRLEIINTPSEKGLVDCRRLFCATELQGFGDCCLVLNLCKDSSAGDDDTKLPVITGYWLLSGGFVS